MGPIDYERPDWIDERHHLHAWIDRIVDGVGRHLARSGGGSGAASGRSVCPKR